MKKTLLIIVGLLYLGMAGCNETPTEVQPTNSDDNSETLSKTTANTCTAYVDASGQNVIIEATLYVNAMTTVSEEGCLGSGYPFLHVHIRRLNYTNSVTNSDLPSPQHSICIRSEFTGIKDLWIEGRVGDENGSDGWLNTTKTLNLKYTIPINAGGSYNFENSATDPGQQNTILYTGYYKYIETSNPEQRPSSHRGFVRGNNYTIQFYPWWNGPTGQVGETLISTTFTIPPPQNYTLTLAASTGGTTSPAPGNHVRNQGETLSILAQNYTGYEFTGWTGSVTTTQNPYIVTFNSNQTMTANFQQKNVTSVTMSDNGSQGQYKNASGVWTNLPTDVELTGTNEYTVTGFTSSYTTKQFLIKTSTTVTPSDAINVTYKWYKNGSYIGESSSAAYVLTEAYTTHDLTLKVEAWQSGVKKAESAIFTYHCVVDIP